MQAPCTNHLLESLPAELRMQLMSHLQPVVLPVGSSFFQAGEMPRQVTFLCGGIASLVTEMSGGEGVEVGLAGREGIVEGLSLLGPIAPHVHCFMQVAGTGFQMDFRAFQDEFFQKPEVSRLVLQHVQYEALAAAQFAACNRLHEVEERLARWLLMVSGRLKSLEIELTQEFLGEMLGARRSTVTLAAGALQRSGLIEYRRGRIRILDRDGLLDAACECFGVVEQAFAQLYSG